MEIPVIIAVFAVVLHAWWQDRRITELEDYVNEHCQVLESQADAIDILRDKNDEKQHKQLS